MSEKIHLRGPEVAEVRIVLVGKTGAGKSAVGNTILGQKRFKSHPASKSVTQECAREEGKVEDTRVVVIDSPGLFDTSLTNDKLINEIVKCIKMSSPGPHVFLLVLQLGRFTAEEKDTVKQVEYIFGQGAARYMMVLFTRGDDLDENETIEDYVKEAEDDLKEFIRQCGNRYHVFNNKSKDPDQVYSLMSKISQMVSENGGSCFTNEMYRLEEERKAAEERRRREEEETEAQRKRLEEEERIRQEVARKIKKMGNKWCFIS